MFEAMMSYTAGRMGDTGIGKHQVALLSGIVRGVVLSIWSVYHIYAKGAARMGSIKNRTFHSEPGLV